MKTLAVLAAENKIGNHATSSPCFSVKLELTCIVCRWRFVPELNKQTPVMIKGPGEHKSDITVK